MKQVILYGIAGADKHYKVLRYFIIEEEFISISNMQYCAFIMQDKCPEVKAVYAVDNRHGLRRDYIEATTKDSVESCVEFKDILERDGIRVR